MELPVRPGPVRNAGHGDAAAGHSSGGSGLHRQRHGGGTFSKEAPRHPRFLYRAAEGTVPPPVHLVHRRRRGSHSAGRGDDGPGLYRPAGKGALRVLYRRGVPGRRGLRGIFPDLRRDAGG